MVGLDTKAPGPEPLPEPVDHRDLFQHQREALTFAKERDYKFALFLDMGLGKSRTAVEILRESGTLRHALIVAPLSVIPVLESEFRKWAAVDLTVVHGSLEERLRALRRPGPWIVNYEGLRIVREGKPKTVRGRKVKTEEYPVADAILDADVRALILDESTRIKDPKAKASRIVHQLVKTEDYPVRVVMSGHPMPQSVLDLWSQLAVIERPPRGYRSRYHMQSELCIMGGYQQKEIVGYRELEAFHHSLGEVAFRRRTDDCLDLPELSRQRVPVKLEGKELKAYKSMVKDAVAELSRREVVTADNVLTKILRLQQITGGAAAPRRQGAKLKALLDLVEDTEPPVIIWCLFTDEIETVARALGKSYRVRTFYGKTPRSERTDTLTAFENGAVDVLVGQPGAGGLGLNLQKSAVCIYYSTGYNGEHREQSERRIYRAGQTRRTRIIDIVADGTVDDKVLKALREKVKVSQVVVDGWKEWIK